MNVDIPQTPRFKYALAVLKAVFTNLFVAYCPNRHGWTTDPRHDGFCPECGDSLQRVKGEWI